MVEAIDFVTAGDVSDLSDLSDDEEFENNAEEIHLDAGDIDGLPASESGDERETFSDEDEIPLAQIAESSKTTNAPSSSTTSATPAAATDTKRVFRWRKKDTIDKDVSFREGFSDPPAILPTPYQYFRMFFPSSLDDLVAEQTNLYSVQKSHKSIKTTAAEITSLIGMMMKMGIIQLPSYQLYWNQSFRQEAIAEVMPKNRFYQLLSNLHFVNNLEIDKTDKLAKVRPVINAVRDECVKVEPEEYHSIDEQNIPSKTKYSVIRQYNPKKPKKMGIQEFGQSWIVWIYV